MKKIRVQTEEEFLDKIIEEQSYQQLIFLTEACYSCSIEGNKKGKNWGKIIDKFLEGKTLNLQEKRKLVDLIQLVSNEKQ